MKLGKFLIKLLNMLSDNETKKRRKHYPPHGEFEETINIPYIEGSFNPQTSFDVYLANDNRNNICVIDIHGGAYIFGNDMFVLSDTAKNNYRLDDAGISMGSFMQAVAFGNEEFTQCGGAVMVAPGQCELSFGLQTAVQGGSFSNIETKSFFFDVEPGYRNIVNVTVDPASKAFIFNVNVINWDEEENIIELPDPRV